MKIQSSSWYQRERQTKIREQKRTTGLRKYTFWAPVDVPELALPLILAEPETAAQMRRAMKKEKRVFVMKNKMYYFYASETDKNNDKPTAVRLNVFVKARGITIVLEVSQLDLAGNPVGSDLLHIVHIGDAIFMGHRGNGVHHLTCEVHEAHRRRDSNKNKNMKREKKSADAKFFIAPIGRVKKQL